VRSNSLHLVIETSANKEMMMKSSQEKESTSTISIGGVQLSLTPGPGCSGDGKSLSILKFSNGEVSIDLNGFVGTLQLACQEQRHNSMSANVDIAATASLRSILGLDGVSTPPMAITATSTTFERSLTTETSGRTETGVATYIQDLIRDFLTAPGGMAKNSLNLGRFLATCRGCHDASKSALLELKENYGSLKRFLELHKDVFSVPTEHEGAISVTFSVPQKSPCFQQYERSNTWLTQNTNESHRTSNTWLTQNFDGDFNEYPGDSNRISSSPTFAVPQPENYSECCNKEPTKETYSAKLVAKLGSQGFGCSHSGGNKI